MGKKIKLKKALFIEQERLLYFVKFIVCCEKYKEWFMHVEAGERGTVFKTNFDSCYENIVYFLWHIILPPKRNSNCDLRMRNQNGKADVLFAFRGRVELFLFFLLLAFFLFFVTVLKWCHKLTMGARLMWKCYQWGGIGCQLRNFVDFYFHCSASEGLSRFITTYGRAFWNIWELEFLQRTKFFLSLFKSCVLSMNVPTAVSRRQANGFWWPWPVHKCKLICHHISILMKLFGGDFCLVQI